MTNVLIELSNVITFFNQRFLMTFINKERTTFLLLSDKPIFNFDLIRTFLVENQLNDFCTKEIDLIKSKIDNFLDIRTRYNQIPKNTNNDLHSYSYVTGNRTHTNQLYDHIKYCSYIENTFKIPTKQNFENLISENVNNENMFFYNVSIGFMFLRMFELSDILNAYNIQLIEQPQQIKVVRPKKEFLDFIHNVNDKEKFIFELINIFKTEIGIDFRIIIEQLKENNILIIGNRELKLFVEVAKVEFKRNIGTVQSINDNFKNTAKDKDNYFENIKAIIEKLKPLIVKHKQN